MLKRLFAAFITVSTVSSCEGAIFAALATPKVPESAPKISVSAIAGWRYTSEELRLLVVPDYSAVTPSHDVHYLSVYPVVDGMRIGIDVTGIPTTERVGRPAEVASGPIAVAPGRYEIIANQGEVIAVIDTNQGRGGKAF